MDVRHRIFELHEPGIAPAWTALWERSPQRGPFSTLAFAAAMARAAGCRAEGLFVYGAEEAEPAAGALVFHRQRGPFRETFVPPFTAASGILLGGAEAEADVHHRRSLLGRLLAALEARYAMLALHLPPGLTDVRPARWRGWDAVPLYTYVQDLTGDAPLTDGWSSGTRRTLEREREAFIVEQNGNAIDTAVALCAESYARHGRALPLGAGALAEAARHLHRAGRLRVHTTPRVDGEVEAAVGILHDGRTACYWIAGSRPGPAMTVLLGALLPRLRDEGYHRFDFIGANTPSIAEFKRRLGPTLTPYFRVATATRPVLRLLRRLRG